MKMLKTRILWKGNFYQLRIQIEAPKYEETEILQFIEREMRKRGIIG